MRSMRSAEVPTSACARTTCGSRWAASPRSCRARTRSAPEWNTAALGESKRKIAAELFGRLKERYAPFGLAHFGQGKWYPGEPLPRWSLNCFWRKDGEPIWSDASLVAQRPDAIRTRPRTRRGCSRR